jgi:RNA polymerase primary sigma factor
MTRLGGDSPDPENHLGRYLKEVESYPRLSDDEERALLEVVAASGIGRESARRRVIEANLRLAVEVARGYQSTGRHLLDLIQEGNLGLVRAVESFDPRAQHKFETLARWSIREAIASAIRGQ